ncbi:hypothetical protein GCM10023205_76770 [Yinghuangia aomiensis]|uniref:Uncharacterized protein n=1 Tax=Yinghuangia aomiensis TaxID=676205 RepID=A0ABP9IB89_9ACTN
MPFLRISRLTVEGLRPSSAAIARMDARSRNRSAMWMRSCSRKYRDGRSGASGWRTGGYAFVRPDALRPFRHRLPVR